MADIWITYVNFSGNLRICKSANRRGLEFNKMATGTSSGHGGGGGPHKTPNFPYCPEIGKYEKMAKVGQGTFG